MDDGTGKADERERHTEGQIIGALKRIEVGRAAEDFVLELCVNALAIYIWKTRFDGMDVSEAEDFIACSMRTRG